jgi:hypothetical protein
MQTLWLAIFIYSVGLGLVLHFRPALMFNANGSWKEFGYKRDARYTMFPVWLFAIAWAILSYGIAAAIGGMTGGESAMAATAATTAYLNSSPFDESAEEEYMPSEEDDYTEMEAVSEMPPPPPPQPSMRRPRGRPRKQPRPGYYVLDPASEREGGLRRYIYYGNAAPADGVEEPAGQAYSY